MRYVMNRSTRQGRASRRAAATAVLLLLALTVGCSKSEPAGNSTQDDGNHNTTAPVQTRAVELDGNAPTVDEAYPHLASAALVHARLVDLPDGTILQSDGVTIRDSDINAEIVRASEELRDQLSKNAFFLLEQKATRRLLEEEAKAAAILDSKQSLGQSEEELLQTYLRKLVAEVKVGDEEVAAFYKDNRDMVGQATLEQVTPQIRQYLLRDKQQQAVDEHIRTLGRRTSVLVSAGWVERQAQRAKDNSVDKARASGKPTFASFGADTCIPCQKMAPTREAVREKYDGKVNVVYVHVGKEQVLASRYGVQGIPLVLFFDADGREVLRHTGLMSQEQIEGKLAEMGVK
ncbi:thioredoxin family protein [Anaerobaca lacustris]|uniref:Thioredoxin domain-containing protein n=1 Tax=Anaerobaca lacustris TaxID=3044600 RepID=A0AAW6U669_9BACT|nr:thioredoxin domain-containing protein [Sedimentisphaerales bacterium M17dextr]